MLDADRSTLFINDEKTNELYTEIGQGLGATTIRLPNHLGIAGTVFTSGHSVNIPHAYADLRFNPAFDRKTGFFTRSILCVPVANKNGKVIGVTQVLNKRGGTFTSEDEARLKAFTSQISIGLENAKLFDDVQTDQELQRDDPRIDVQRRHHLGRGRQDRDLQRRRRRASSRRAHQGNGRQGRRRNLHRRPTPGCWTSSSLSRRPATIETTVDAKMAGILEPAELNVNVTVMPLRSGEKRLGSMVMIEDISNEKRMKSTMSRYMDPALADKLLAAGEDALGGQSVEATMLFSDVRGFTTLSEELGAQGIVSLLNEYFTLMVECISDQGGMLDKFIGDAIMAKFGIPPLTHEDDEDRAVRTSIAMMRALNTFNARRAADGKRQVDIGIGLNTDMVVSGNIGSPTRMEYAVIGDGVNLASRLEIGVQGVQGQHSRERAHGQEAQGHLSSARDRLHPGQGQDQAGGGLSDPRLPHRRIVPEHDGCVAGVPVRAQDLSRGQVRTGCQGVSGSARSPSRRRRRQDVRRTLRLPDRASARRELGRRVGDEVEVDRDPPVRPHAPENQPMKFDPPRRAVAIAGFSAFLDLYAPQSVLSDLAGEFRIDPSGAGAIVGVTTLAVAAAAPFAGMIADRFGQRRTIMIAIFALVPVTALLAAVQNLDQMLVLRFAQGLLLPAIFSSAIAFTAENWPAHEAADVTGLYVLGSVLGGFSGRFLTALAAEFFGWRGGLLGLTAVTVLAAAGLWAWLPPRPRRGPVTRAPGIAALLDHVRNPAILATCAVGASMLFANVATFTYIDFRLAQPPFSLGATERGAIFVVYLIGSVATPVSGTLIRRLGRRRALGFSVGLGALGMLATLADSIPAVVVGLVFFVIGVFIAQTASLGFVGQTARHNKTTAVGLYICCYYVGGSLGAVVPGWLWNSAGWSGCVALVVATTAAATSIAMVAWRERGAPPSSG